MTYLFHIVVCLILIIFQTAVKPQVLFLSGLYDVLTAYIIYLGLFHRVREILPIILISGMTMDAISGGPMGLFLTTYLWLFLLTRWTTRLIHKENLVLPGPSLSLARDVVLTDFHATRLYEERL